jgi:hypothetical protein
MEGQSENGCPFLYVRKGLERITGILNPLFFVRLKYPQSLMFHTDDFWRKYHSIRSLQQNMFIMYNLRQI